MTGRRRLVALVVAAGLLALGTVPSVRLAQAEVPGGVTVRFHGLVHVGSLPAARPGSPGLAARSMSRRVPDPERLLTEKAGASRTGGATGPGAPGAGPSREPSLAPSVLTGFIGLRRSDGAGFIPPDTQVAAGPAHLLEVVNAQVRIFAKTGGTVTTFSLESLFGLPVSADLFDPRVRFDAASGRWLLSAASDESTQGSWRLAVSSTSDPTGAFAVYSVATPGRLPDFPAVGVSDDKVVLTANAFACTTSCNGGFLGTQLVVFRKADLLAGAASPAVAVLGPDQGLFSIQPAQSLSSTSTLFMAAVDSGSASTIRVWSVTGLPPGAVSLATVDRPIRSLSSPPPAAQLGSATTIDSGDNRLLDAVYRAGSLWVAANSACVPAGDTATRACLRFVEVRTASLSVAQDFDFGQTGVYLYYPAIQLDGAGNLVTVFSRSSATEFASVYASGRLAVDPPNTLQAPTLLKAGEASYNPFANRWGDYSGAAVDPADSSAVWVAGQYTRIEGGSEWGTWIAELRLLFNGGVFVAAGNLDGAGADEIVTGADTGGAPRVRTFTGGGAPSALDFLAYAPSFAGGVRVASCDVTGDGRADIITAAGPGGGPHVRVFDGVTGAVVTEFFAYAPTFTGGVFVACGDLTGDGRAEIITGADAGGGPHVVAWQVTGGAPVPLRSFFAYSPGFTGGVRVAACDVDGDGAADIVTGAGPGGGPHVRVWSGATGAELAGFFAYTPGFAGGVYVACGDVTGSGAPEIVTGAGAGGGPHVRVFTGLGADTGVGFFAYSPVFAGGVRVAVGDLDGAGKREILTGAGPGGGSDVRGFTGAGGDAGTSFFAY